MAGTAEDIFGQSDEEIMNMVSPPSFEEEEEEDEQNPADEEQSEEVAEESQEEDAATEDAETDEEESEDEEEADAPTDSEVDPHKDEGEKAETESKADTETQGTVDYEAFYKKIMTPFKANGRTIELRSPEEAIQLMQMGANFTRKMQDIAPHRKILAMLDNNGLLDEGKLSFLIDLDKKNPDAIKKIIKDSGIDVLDIDTSAETSYQPSNHSVSDTEVTFRTHLDDLNSSPEGQATLQFINLQWDQASKEALWANPEIMQVIHQQRANGIYDRIAKEVDRRKSLGSVPFDMPFVQAYRLVGDQLHQSGAFNDLIQQAPVVQAKTRVAAPKARVTNSGKAASAGTPRSGNKPTNKAFVNPLSMSDEDFMKQMENRL